MALSETCWNQKGSSDTQYQILCFGDILWLIGVLLLMFFTGILLYRSFLKYRGFNNKKIYFIVWLNFYNLVFIMGAIVAGAFFYSLQDFIMNLTYTGLLFYFSLKYVKLNDGFKNKQQQIGFFIFFGLYLIFLIFSFVYEILTKTNICSKKHGIFVIIGGMFPAICLLILGSKQTKKMRKAIDNVVENDPSVSMKYIVSKEQQIDNLWELIVVYGIAKFMSLMVVIYFIVDSDQGIGMDDCYFLPKDRLKKEPNFFLLEIFLQIIIYTITILLPFVYTMRLFWIKPKKSKQSRNQENLINQDENYVSFNDKEVNSKKKSKENLNVVYDSQKIEDNLNEKLLKTD